MIPPNARVIEWRTDKHGLFAAQRGVPKDSWLVTDIRGYQTEDEMRWGLGLTAENLVVLATFPEPTLANIVGDYSEFRFRLKAMTHKGMWCYAYKDGTVWRFGSGTYESLDDLDRYGDIELSTVVPLVHGCES